MNSADDIYRLSLTMSERAVARALGLPRSTVHYWVARRGTPAGTKSGRPRVTDDHMDRRIVRSVRQNPFVSAVELRRHLVPNVSTSTVRNRIRSAGFKGRTPAAKPFLTPVHRNRRCEFASDKVVWTPGDWAKVVFSDEKIFRNDGHGPLRVYRPRGNFRFDERYVHTKTATASRFTICVWLGFSAGDPTGRYPPFREIHLVEQPTLNAQYYTNVILRSIRERLRRYDYTFMQDLSSIHTSQRVQDWLSRKQIEVMDDWPPKGADMNPVENVWGEITRRLFEKPPPANRDELWRTVRETFESLDDAYFSKLVESMPRRMLKVAQSNGGWTKY